jgi:hypothetical protein
MKPQLFVLDGESLSDLTLRLAPLSVVDAIDEQLEDLFLIRNPKYKFIPDHQEAYMEFQKEIFGTRSKEYYGTWVFFPWSKSLIHVLPEAEWHEARTGRNRNLITDAEQQTFANSVVAIAGLSVGSHVALTITMMGGAHKIVLADPDVLSLSNLNRIRSGASQIGRSKIDLVAEQIYDMNPYAELVLFPEGITEENVDHFFDDAHVNILVEETDNLGLKILLREEAKKRKIPVVMGTDNGDGVILDVERFDLHSDLALFNGAIGDISIEEFKKFPPQELPKLATKIAGPELAVPRMKDSLLEVGRSIYSWPQLGSAATLCGAVLAYMVRRIAIGAPVREGKFALPVDEYVDSEYLSSRAVSEREEHHRRFMSKLGLDL